MSDVLTCENSGKVDVRILPEELGAVLSALGAQVGRQQMLGLDNPMLGAGAMADLPFRVDVHGLVIVDDDGLRLLCVHGALEPLHAASEGIINALSEGVNRHQDQEPCQYKGQPRRTRRHTPCSITRVPGSACALAPSGVMTSGCQGLSLHPQT